MRLRKWRMGMTDEIKEDSSYNCWNCYTLLAQCILFIVGSICSIVTVCWPSVYCLLLALFVQLNGMVGGWVSLAVWRGSRPERRKYSRIRWIGDETNIHTHKYFRNLPRMPAKKCQQKCQQNLLAAGASKHCWRAGIRPASKHPWLFQIYEEDTVWLPPLLEWYW